MAHSLSTHLMFHGTAEAAMNLYVSLFDGAEVLSVERYSAGEMGPEGSIRLARFRMLGRDFLCIDSPVPHAFSFTPSMSIFVECENERELEQLFSRLSDGGVVMMPPANDGFSKRFAWIQDRYGPSWQLNLG